MAPSAPGATSGPASGAHPVKEAGPRSSIVARVLLVCRRGMDHARGGIEAQTRVCESTLTPYHVPLTSRRAAPSHRASPLPSFSLVLSHRLSCLVSSRLVSAFVLPRRLSCPRSCLVLSRFVASGLVALRLVLLRRASSCLAFSCLVASHFSRLNRLQSPHPVAPAARTFLTDVLLPM